MKDTGNFDRCVGNSGSLVTLNNVRQPVNDTVSCALCHLVIMHTSSGVQRAFAIKAFYRNSDSGEGARREFRRLLI